MNDASRLLEMQLRLAERPPCDLCRSWICGTCGHQRTVRDGRLERRCSRCARTRPGRVEPVYHLVPKTH